jgi:XTP/dITP diphosphohydrolase
MTSTRLLVVGTHNQKKGDELRRLLAPHHFQLRTLADYPEAIEVVEDGDSFAANARRKAVQQARHLGRWVLAEDSGLMVDALDGAPGILSARYSGPRATDQSNNDRLLGELADLPLHLRTAHYVCHATLADAEGRIRAESQDQCRGRIGFRPAGNFGFGYDPLFEVVEYHRTFGQLGPVVKESLSHRARAMRRLVPALLDLARDDWQ